MCRLYCAFVPLRVGYGAGVSGTSNGGEAKANKPGKSTCCSPP